MVLARGWLVALWLALAGCSGSSNPAPDAGQDVPVHVDPTLSSIQANVFKVGCAVSQCHGNGDPQANLILTDAATSLAHLVNIPSVEVAVRSFPDGGLDETGPGSGLYREDLCDALTDGGPPPILVIPGDPDHSYLIWKLTGLDADGGEIEESQDCSQMPKVAGGQLPADQIAAIRQWIAAGALNN